MVPTGTPRSLAASRSTIDLDLGLAERERRVQVHQPRLLLQLGDELARSTPRAVFRSGPGEVDLEGLRPPAALERRDVVDADPQVGIVLEELPGLLLDPNWSKRVRSDNGGRDRGHPTSRGPASSIALFQVGDPHVDRRRA